MKVILIGGKAQAGKDTSAALLKDALEAGGFKTLITHYGDLVKYVCTKFFDWDGNKDAHGRSLLQYVGTDVVRQQAPDFWVSFVCNILKLFKNQWDVVLVPDCRFPNEISCMTDAGFDTTYMRITRPGYDNGLTLEQQAHPSETALDDTVPHIEIFNEGSISDLNDKLSVIADNLMEIMWSGIGQCRKEDVIKEV